MSAVRTRFAGVLSSVAVASCSLFGDLDELQSSAPGGASGSAGADASGGSSGSTQEGGVDGWAGTGSGGSGGNGGSGGSGGAGGAAGAGGSTSNNPCTNCLNANCKDVVDACIGDSDCNEIIVCSQGCADQACVQACYDAASASGQTGYQALLDCAQTHCTAECGA